MEKIRAIGIAVVLCTGCLRLALARTGMSQENCPFQNALADMLFGDYNPGGKLVDTWPKWLGQLSR